MNTRLWLPAVVCAGAVLKRVRLDGGQRLAQSDAGQHHRSV